MGHSAETEQFSLLMSVEKRAATFRPSIGHFSEVKDKLYTLIEKMRFTPIILFPNAGLQDKSRWWIILSHFVIEPVTVIVFLCIHTKSSHSPMNQLHCCSNTIHQVLEFATSIFLQPWTMEMIFIVFIKKRSLAFHRIPPAM